MKTKEIENLYKEWLREWGGLPSDGPTSTEFLVKKIKQHFQRRKPKCVWTKTKPEVQGLPKYTRWTGGCPDAPCALTNSPLGECPNKYCPMCGGKIEVKDAR